MMGQTEAHHGAGKERMNQKSGTGVGMLAVQASSARQRGSLAAREGQAHLVLPLWTPKGYLASWPATKNKKALKRMIPFVVVIFLWSYILVTFLPPPA